MKRTGPQPHRLRSETVIESDLGRSPGYGFVHDLYWKEDTTAAAIRPASVSTEPGQHAFIVNHNPSSRQNRQSAVVDLLDFVFGQRPEPAVFKTRAVKARRQ